MTTRSVVESFLRNLQERNLEAIAALIAERVDWFIPGDTVRAAWLGARNTRDEVKEFFRLLWSRTRPVNASIDHIFIDGKRSVIAGRFETEMLDTGKIVNSLFFIHMMVENGVITWYRLLEDSLAVSQSLKIQPQAKSLEDTKPV